MKDYFYKKIKQAEEDFQVTFKEEDLNALEAIVDPEALDKMRNQMGMPQKDSKIVPMQHSTNKSM